MEILDIDSSGNSRRLEQHRVQHQLLDKAAADLNGSWHSATGQSIQIQLSFQLVQTSACDGHAVAALAALAELGLSGARECIEEKAASNDVDDARLMVLLDKMTLHKTYDLGWQATATSSRDTFSVPYALDTMHKNDN